MALTSSRLELRHGKNVTNFDVNFLDSDVREIRALLSRRQSNIDESEFLIIQYADDTTLLLDDNEVSLNSALNLINAFSEISGLKVNFEKTQAVWIGAKRGCMEEIQTEKPLFWSKTGIFKLLGIRYELYQNDIYKQNFAEKISVIKKAVK